MTAEQRVMVLHLPNAAGQDGDCMLTSVTFKDAKTGQPTCYLLAPQAQLLEVQHFKMMYSAWLMPDQLLADGGMYLATPVDPLFILLPILDKARQQGGGSTSESGVFIPVDQILESVDCQGEAQHVLHKLLGAAQPSLACICDHKSVGGDDYYRLNNDRVLAWLMCKLEQCKQALSSQLAGLDAHACDSYVAAFLSEYLTPAWVAKLNSSLNLSAQDTAPVVKSSAAVSSAAAGQHADKRIKLDPKELARQAARKRAEEDKKAAEKKFAATNKSIKSFFAPAGAKAK